MLQLVVLPPAFGMRNVSPFCLKTEMLLTALELPFELVEQADPRKTPKGKLPYLIDDGTKIADSELIAEHIDAKTQGRVYADMDPVDKAHGTALTRLAEDHLYWMIVASRWLDDAWYPNVVEAFFGIAPALVRPLVAGAARRQVRNTYHLHGLGRHTQAEQRGYAERDLAALDAALPASGFLGGDAPRLFDFTVAAMLVSIYDQQPPTWINAVAEPFDGLRGYAERVQEHVGVWGRK